MTGRVPRGEQELNRAVAEEIVIAIDEDEASLLPGVVLGSVKVPLHRLAIAPGLPLATLDHERNRGRDERQATDMVPVQVGENDHRHRVEVDLLGNAHLLLEAE